jgi:hypothetical protein
MAIFFTGFGLLPSVASILDFHRVDAETYSGKYLFFYFPGSLWNLNRESSQANNIKHYSDLFSSKNRDDLRNGRCVFVIDNSNEAHFTKTNSHLVDLLHDIINNLNAPAGSILLLDQNREIANLREDCEDEKIAFLAKHIVFKNYDYFIKKLINKFASSQNSKNSGSIFSDKTGFEDFFSKKNKAFLALIGSPRLHKVLAYHCLQKNRCVIDGLISYGGFETPKGRPMKQRVLEDLKNDPLKCFLEEVDAASAIENLPTSHLDLDLSNDVNLNNHAESIPFSFYNQTFISFIIETDFTDGSIRRITEKSLKAYAMGHPAIILGNPGSLKLIKDLGFDTFEDLIPSDYDTITDPVERFRLVLYTLQTTVKRITKNPKAFAEKIYERGKLNFLYARSGLKSRYEKNYEMQTMDWMHNK